MYMSVVKHESYMLSKCFSPTLTMNYDRH